MFKSKLAIYLSCLLAFGIFSLSCNSSAVNENLLPMYPDFSGKNPNLFDTSWLTISPCDTPCWHELRLSKTSITDAITAIKELSFINPESLRLVETSLPSKNIESVLAECKESPGKTCVDVRFYEKTLESIYIWPNYQISFDQAIEQLGEPDGFFYTPLGVETSGCYISLIWIKQQMTLSFSEETGVIKRDLCSHLLETNWKVPKNIPVQTVSIVSGDRINSIMLNDTYIIWKGFDD